MDTRRRSDWAIYGDRDPRDIPAYTLRDVAKSLRMPESTLRSWLRGQRNFEPVIVTPADATEYREMSFFNLIEAFVVAELRRVHGVRMPDVRASLSYLVSLFPNVDHPVAEANLTVFDKQVYAVLSDGRHIDLTKSGQFPIENVIRELLERVDNGPRGIERFFPRMWRPDQSRTEAVPATYRPIAVDPEIAFGRPVIAGTGIPTEVIAERRRAGDSIRVIAEDYDRPEEEIREALAYEWLLDNIKAA